eukprot:448865_1
MLTQDSIRQMVMNGSDSWLKPQLQILEVKKIPTQLPSETIRYRIILSDGQHFIQGMFASQCTPLINTNQIKKYTIIHLKKWICKSIGVNKLQICIAFECEVIQQMKYGIGRDRPKNVNALIIDDGDEEMKDMVYDNSLPNDFNDEKTDISYNKTKISSKWEYKTKQNIWKSYDNKMQIIINKLKLGQIHQFTIDNEQQQIYKITTEMAAHTNITTNKYIEMRLNASSCSYYNIAKKILQNIFPSIPNEFFDSKNGNNCYCDECHNKRGDKIIYKRGKPAKKYGLPIGFARFGMKINEGFVKMNRVFAEWHACYHGTTQETVTKIFGSGATLLKPGDFGIGGIQLGVRDGHIQKPFKRKNKYYNKIEIFDPNQIYISPSINYVSQKCYAKWIKCKHPSNKDKNICVQFVFQCRIRPGSYKIGQETIGATKKGLILDTNFTNNEIEWYTKENVGITLHGLLLRFQETK